MAVLGYLPKLKRGPGLAFGPHFLHYFSIKMLFLILYQWIKFQCHTLFLSQDIKHVLLGSYLDS